jgi:phospho-N-acetylmuramoyl-pentapeptide-transferase
MLYYLFEWLQKLNFPGAGMFGYTSFRALMAVILALLISSIWGDKFINLLKGIKSQKRCVMLKRTRSASTK